MKFFIDTANLDEIREAHSLGILDGVTTNPSLIAREGISGRSAFEKHIKTICELTQAPVSAEAVSLTGEEMVVEARSLAEIDPHVVVKIPMTPGRPQSREGAFPGRDQDQCDSCVLAPSGPHGRQGRGDLHQPFVGRLDDISLDGMKIIEQIIEIFANYLFEAEVIVASIRNPLHVLAAARLGADIATIPFKVIGQLAQHP